ncbi:hypothetical protein U1Q18_014644 [Sarracenia purpurea var. burkii]
MSEDEKQRGKRPNPKLYPSMAPPIGPRSVLLHGAITAPLSHHRCDPPPSPARNQRGPSQRKERKGSKPSTSTLPSSPTSTHLR